MGEHDVWRRVDMRCALAVRDIGMVYDILQRFGISQRRIAASVGQVQSEVSEVLSGRRVASYDVLARIADGLGVPRGYLGLQYDDETQRLVERSGWIAARLAKVAPESGILPPIASLRPEFVFADGAVAVNGRVDLHVITSAPTHEGEVATARALGPVQTDADC